MDRLGLPMGESDFRIIRETGCYYIDKTRYIVELIRDSAKSILFTRPRRFGKTTFQSMLRYFFDIREDSRDIFAGLEVMNDEEAVNNWMNKYPVIYLTLREIDGSDYKSSEGRLIKIIAKLFKNYSFLLNDSMYSDDKASFTRLMTASPTHLDLVDSLSLLASLLCNHYGKKVIILIDEYDVPLDKANNNGYYNEMLNTIRAIFHSVLKDNSFVMKGILTGCLRISKESLFTGLNNLTVYSITGYEYPSAFGFTEDEVMRLLHDADLEDKADIIKQWYNGYSIGGVGIYTPWDVISYVKTLQANRDAEPENYWANTSGNEAIRRLIDMSDAEVGDDYSTLIDGGVIRKRIIETLTYRDLYESAENVWSLFLMTGYLTLAGTYRANKENELRIPNEEIKSLFASSVENWFSQRIMNTDRRGLFDALWLKNDAELSKIISEYLFDTISYYDYREDYYHAFLAGLLSGAGYVVKSNRETGTGRSDIMLFDRKNKRVAVFELKRTESKDGLKDAADKAVKQLEENKYGHDLSGYRRIIGFGVSFFRKEALVKVADIDISQ